MKYVIEDASLIQIADKFRDILDISSDQKYPISDFPVLIENVENYSKYITEQEQWDAIQNNGQTVTGWYAYGFSGAVWNDNSFNPKYDIIAKGDASHLFAQTAISDLIGKLNVNSLKLDTSGASYMSYFFYNANKITRIPTVDCTGLGASTTTNFIAQCDNLDRVDEIILKDDGSQNFTSSFSNNPKLKAIKFSGKIGFSINFSKSTELAKSAIKNIIESLSDTASGKTLTLSETAVLDAFPAGDGELSEEFVLLANTKQNWTISLV